MLVLNWLYFPGPSLHVKSHPRPGDLPPLLPGTPREGGSAPTSPQPPQMPAQEPVVMPGLHARDLHLGDLGRGRWVNSGLLVVVEKHFCSKGSGYGIP